MFLLSAVASVVAQRPAARLHSEIADSGRVQLPDSRTRRARFGADAGEVPNSLPITAMHLQFSRTAAQEADLQALIAAQHDPASPLYHQWLTPEQFGARFGVADSDIEATEQWLTGKGLTVDSVARARNSIEFSGTAGAVAQAFGTSLHYYTAGSDRNFAPETDLTLPASLAGITLAVNGLDNYKLRPHHIVQQASDSSSPLHPSFTSSQTGNHYLQPGDVATIYDIKPLYSSGYTGSGQAIAVMGQSAIVSSDITNFQTAAGLTPKAPTLLLVPNTGASTINPFGDGDEGESDLDLEYTGGIATGAQIIFVYTGGTSTQGVIQSLTYAVDNRVAPIISFSYGDCEYDSGTGYEAILAQAVTQGQTVIASSGDSGVEACYVDTNLTAALRQQVGVSYPASSAYVTALGGTQTLASALTASTSGTAYWSGSSSADIISSALTYLPEVVWNETTTSSTGASYIGASGGGTSASVMRPSWQTGVTGIATGAYRLVPDISLQASSGTPGYLYCSSDADSLPTGTTGSCGVGFRATSDGKSLTVAGGTSFAAPIFAGMVAILNQATNSTGQGLVAKTLYSLASNAATYASAFHDITSGLNNCPTTVSGCSSAASTIYAAGTGYDEATGLGSIDLANLVAAWPKSAASVLTASTTTVTAATSTPSANSTDLLTIKVGPSSNLSTLVPTGTVSLDVDGTTLPAITLTGGAATYTYPGAASGAHTVVATYSGDATFAPSSTTTVLTVASGSFTLSGTAISVSAGTTGTSTITIAPTNGYTGTLGIVISANVSIANACAKPISNVSVTSGTTPVTTTLTVGTSLSACNALASTGGSAFVWLGPKTAAANSIPALPPSQGPASRHPFSLALAALGFGAIGWRKRRSVRLRALMGFGILAILAAGASGCSSSSNSGGTTSTNNAATGSYTLTLTGTDTTNSAITATTTVALNIH